jgi:GTP-binding protein Era
MLCQAQAVSRACDTPSKLKLLYPDDMSLRDKIYTIATEIYGERVSKRAIIIGHKGENIKKVGIQAREDLEKFFGKKVFLEQFVKVEPDWRAKTDKLRSFGYSLD